MIASAWHRPMISHHAIIESIDFQVRLSNWVGLEDFERRMSRLGHYFLSHRSDSCCSHFLHIIVLPFLQNLPANNGVDSKRLKKSLFEETVENETDKLNYQLHIGKRVNRERLSNTKFLQSCTKTTMCLRWCYVYRWVCMEKGLLWWQE